MDVTPAQEDQIISEVLVGLYNDAVTYHSVVFSGAPLIDKAEELYKKTIDECYKQIEDENENQKEKDNYCNMVLQYALYNLGLLYFRDYGEYKRHDLGLFYGLKDEFAASCGRTFGCRYLLYTSLKDNVGSITSSA